jgi:phosphate transport system substrate-binding protein
MSKNGSSPRPASQSLLTIEISKSGTVIILAALALIAVLVALDLRARVRVQAAPKAAGDAAEIAESKPDAAVLAPEPSPSETSEASTGERAPVHVMRPVAEEDTAAGAPDTHRAYASEVPKFRPVAAAALVNESNNSNDTPQPTSPATPAAASNSPSKISRAPGPKPVESTPPQENGPLSLAGAGADFPYPIYAKWFTKFQEDANKQHADIRIAYSAVGSGGGISEVLKGKVDFGATDIAMSDEQMTKAKGDILHVPTVLRAVVPVYNIPGITGEVKFTAEVLADIYLGKITSWDDEAIVGENPGKNFPNQQIIVVHRSDGNPTTYLFTDFLSKVSDEWRSSVGVGSSVRWPLGMGAKEDEGVIGTVRRLEGAIGYVDMRFAKENRLATGSVRNAEGKFVTASMESLTEAAASIRDMPPDFRVSFTNAPGAKAYPITGFTWFLVPMEQKSAPRREALIGFLRWMLDRGETMTTGLDYAPLPKNVSGEVRRRIAGLQ